MLQTGADFPPLKTKECDHQARQKIMGQAGHRGKAIARKTGRIMTVQGGTERKKRTGLPCFSNGATLIRNGRKKLCWRLLDKENFAGWI